MQETTVAMEENDKKQSALARTDRYHEYIGTLQTGDHRSLFSDNNNILWTWVPIFIEFWGPSCSAIHL